MSYRSNRFNNAMLSMDVSGIDQSKDRNRSDGGLGVRRMISAIDYDDQAETAREKTIHDDRAEKLFNAEMMLSEADKSYLIRVLLLIVENGAEREESINTLAASSKTWNAARKKYFEHRNELLQFFKSDSSAHGYIGGHDIPPRPTNQHQVDVAG